MSISVVVEGDTDEPIVRKLASDARLDIAAVYDMGGKDQLDLRLRDFNNAARGTPWVVLRDLDHDSDCAPTYVQRFGWKRAPWMVFRLAVRELEAWLLADREGLAEYMGLPLAAISEEPDELDDPTQVLVNLARRSRKRAIVRAFVPKENDFVAVGPGYEGALIEFGSAHWSLHRACKRSPSLRSAREALRELSARWSRHIGK